MSRFDHIRYDAESLVIEAEINRLAKALELQIVSSLEPGRAALFALAKLEETVMWARKAIRDDQLDREGCILG